MDPISRGTFSVLVKLLSNPPLNLLMDPIDHFSILHAYFPSVDSSFEVARWFITSLFLVGEVPVCRTGKPIKDTLMRRKLIQCERKRRTAARIGLLGLATSEEGEGMQRVPFSNSNVAEIMGLCAWLPPFTLYDYPHFLGCVQPRQGLSSP